MGASFLTAFVDCTNSSRKFEVGFVRYLLAQRLDAEHANLNYSQVIMHNACRAKNGLVVLENGVSTSSYLQGWKLCHTPVVTMSANWNGATASADTVKPSLSPDIPLLHMDLLAF